MKILAVISGKALIRLLKLLGHNGSALPGLIAERLYPDLLSAMLSNLDKGVAVVTGTNGKTTTTKMLSHMLTASGHKVFTNRSGSNFTRGVLSAVMNEASWTGKLNYDIAVIELDEAYAPKIAKVIKPRLLLALNVVRDQLDRYGEVASTANMIKQAAEHSQTVVLNNNDSPIANIADGITGEAVFFGISPSLKKLLPSDDELYGSSDSKPKTDSPAVELRSLKPIRHGQEITVAMGGQDRSLKLTQEGLHNATNAVSAIAAFQQLETDMSAQEKGLESLSSLSPAFGRGETLSVKGKEITICLVKNPAGFNQGLNSFIKSDTDRALVAINDSYADGRDVSWLWDVSFDSLKAVDLISVSGVRAYDMALRLQYDGIKVAKTNPSLEQSIVDLLEDSNRGKNVVIFPTYTAMLQIRKILSKYTKVDPIW